MKRLIKKKSGFTLIELMVVISIISLLSTIVLTSLSGAKANARNAKRITMVKQYMNALELYKSDHNGSYPFDSNLTNQITTNGITRNYQVCLGIVDTGSCNLGYPGSTSMITNLQSYIKGVPPLTDSVMYNTTDLSGLLYDCENISNNSSCSSYQLKWYGEGSNPFCGPGTKNTTWGIPVVATQCYVISN